MPGVTKHIFEHDIRDIKDMWNKEIKTIEKVLPKYYTENDVITYLKKFYPYEWESVEIKRRYYRKKDAYLLKKFGRARYKMKAPEDILIGVHEYKKIISHEYRMKYSETYDEENSLKECEKLWNKRKPKIDRVDKKIDLAKQKTQQMTPAYLEQLIGLYERKNTSQKDKMYILLELKKYYNDRVIQFFFKLNDTELNKQLRWIAFYHLQSFNYQPRARRQKYMQVHTKNKKRKEYLKKVYPNEKYDIPKNPTELEYRINNSKEQKLKRFDYFISHSSIDSTYVQKVITYENKKEKNIFCDWINDSDYLKRNLVCNATLKVIEKRLEQSDAVIFVESDNSLASIWCKYELNYFEQFNRPIYVIKIEDICNDHFELVKMEEKWYMDSEFEKIKLF